MADETFWREQAQIFRERAKEHAHTDLVATWSSCAGWRFTGGPGRDADPIAEAAFCAQARLAGERISASLTERSWTIWLAALREAGLGYQIVARGSTRLNEAVFGEFRAEGAPLVGFTRETVSAEEAIESWKRVLGDSNTEHWIQNDRECPLRARGVVTAYVGDTEYGELTRLWAGSAAYCDRLSSPETERPCLTAAPVHLGMLARFPRKSQPGRPKGKAVNAGRLRNYRYPYTQEDFAEKLDVSVATIQRGEAGESWDVDTFDKVAKNLTDLLGKEIVSADLQ